MTISALIAALFAMQAQAMPATKGAPTLTAEERQQLGSMYRAIDVNRNGRLSKTEMSAFGMKFGFSGIVADKGWSVLDQNRDGSLTQEEFSQGMARFRQMAMESSDKGKRR